MTAVYESDFLAWAREQAELARSGRINALDLPHIAEELEALGRAERNALASYFERLMLHLLKWQYQPTHRGSSWEVSIADSRNKIRRLLKSSPSLGFMIQEAVEDEWPGAVRKASIQTKRARGTFPASCPWTEAQLLDPDFLPD
jgi:hypothetical protein